MSVRGVWASYHQSVGRCRSLRRTNYLQSKETIQNTMRHPRAHLPLHRFPSATGTAELRQPRDRENTVARAPRPTLRARRRRAALLRGTSRFPHRLPGSSRSNKSTGNRPIAASPPDGDPRGGCGSRVRKTRHVPTVPRAQVYFPFCSVMRTRMKSSLPGGAKHQNTNRKKSPHLWCPSAHLHVGNASQWRLRGDPAPRTGQRGGAGATSHRPTRQGEAALGTAA